MSLSDLAGFGDYAKVSLDFFHLCISHGVCTA
jgi:hypothetical protein